MNISKEKTVYTRKWRAAINFLSSGQKHNLIHLSRDQYLLHHFCEAIKQNNKMQFWGSSCVLSVLSVLQIFFHQVEEAQVAKKDQARLLLQLSVLWV